MRTIQHITTYASQNGAGSSATAISIPAGKAVLGVLMSGAFFGTAAGQVAYLYLGPRNVSSVTDGSPQLAVLVLAGTTGSGLAQQIFFPTALVVDTFTTLYVGAIMAAGTRAEGFATLQITDI